MWSYRPEDRERILVMTAPLTPAAERANQGAVLMTMKPGKSDPTFFASLQPCSSGAHHVRTRRVLKTTRLHPSPSPKLPSQRSDRFVFMRLSQSVAFEHRQGERMDGRTCGVEEPNIFFSTYSVPDCKIGVIWVRSRSSLQQTWNSI